MMRNNIDADLEELIDRAGLGHILAALTTICHGKADHVRSNWQDHALARAWDRAAAAIDHARDGVDV
jgi:hypothetical protein